MNNLFKTFAEWNPVYDSDRDYEIYECEDATCGICDCCKFKRFMTNIGCQYDEDKIDDSSFRLEKESQ